MNKVFYYYGKEVTLDILNHRIIKLKKVDYFLKELREQYEKRNVADNTHLFGGDIRAEMIEGEQAVAAVSEMIDNLPAGSINEAGIINDLKRRGFTLFNCLCELAANSIDAKCNKLRFEITEKYIKIIDNGSGMNLPKLKDMFDMLKSNHLNDKSMGVSGLGGKAATLTLSKEQRVDIYTFDGEKYLTANVPWMDIVKQKKYIDMIKISDMNDESIEDFKNDREGKGTTIKLPYDNQVHKEIVKNFDEQRLKLRINERFDVIFGNFPEVEISLIDNTEPTNNSILQRYDYFSKEDYSYYKGKNIALIHIFSTNKSKNIDLFGKKMKMSILKLKKLVEDFLKRLHKLVFHRRKNINMLEILNLLMQ